MSYRDFYIPGPLGSAHSHQALHHPDEDPSRHPTHVARYDPASQTFQESNHALPFPVFSDISHHAQQKSELADPLGYRWDSSSNKTYTLWDVNIMYNALGHYFRNRDQLRSAQDSYMARVGIPGTSPVDAFRQAAVMSALAREVDARDAHLGGLIYHFENLRGVFCSGGKEHCVSSDLAKDIRNAKASRKVQEIKKLMATDRLENARGPIMENLQIRPANARGPGAGARAEVAAVSSGGMKCNITDEANNENDVKDETVTERRLSDH